MGTNYYVKGKECKSCGKFDKLYICKLSFGWRALIQLHKEFYNNFKEFEKFVHLRDGFIIDEDKQMVSASELLDLIKGKKDSKQHEAPLYTKEADFIMDDFS